MPVKIGKSRELAQQTPPEERAPTAPILPDEATQESQAHKDRAERAGRPDPYDSDPERNEQGEQNVSEGLMSDTDMEEAEAGEKKDTHAEREQDFVNKMRAEGRSAAPGKNKAKEEKPKDAPPAPKTSPAAKAGMTVIFRSQDSAKHFNGSKDQVGIIVRDWGRCVNIHVLPDCGDAYTATSVQRIHPDNEQGEGWFTTGEHEGYLHSKREREAAAKEKPKTK